MKRSLFAVGAALVLSGPVFAQTMVSDIEDAVTHRLNTLAGTVSGGGLVRFNDVLVAEDGRSATVTGLSLGPMDGDLAFLTIERLVVMDLVPTADPTGAQLRNIDLQGVRIGTQAKFVSEGTVRPNIVIENIQLRGGNLDELVQKVSRTASAGGDTDARVLELMQSIELQNLTMRNIQVVGIPDRISIDEIIVQDVGEGSIGRFAVSGALMKDVDASLEGGVDFLEVVDTNLLSLQGKFNASPASRQTDEQQALKAFSLLADEGLLRRATLRGARLGDNGFLMTVGEFTVEGLTHGILDRLLLADISFKEKNGCAESCMSLSQLEIGRNNFLRLVHDNITGDDARHADMDLVVFRIFMDMTLARAVVKEVELEGNFGKLGGKFLGVENFHDGSADAVAISGIYAKIPDDDIEFRVGDVESSLASRHQGKWPTRAVLKVRGLSIKMPKSERAATDPVLASDTLELDATISSRWHEPGGRLEIDPLVVAVKDQFEFQAEATLSGLPPLEEFMEGLTRDPLRAEDPLMRMVQSIALDNLSMRLDERGMVARLVEMAVKDAGMNDPEQLYAVIQSEGGRELGAMIGPELADRMVGPVVAFLRQGGALLLSAHPRSPLDFSALDSLAMDPRRIGEIIDLGLEHRP